MNLNIGEKIKDLRKKNDITQERLGEYLGVCFQTVSKWETNSAYPDITLLPAIATFFSVTTDDLLGVDVFKMQDGINGYMQEYEKLSRTLKHSQSLELMRKAYDEFPNDFKIMNAYCSALVNDPEHIYDGIKFHAQEIIKICQNIYRDCTEDNLRYSAKAFLCKAYAVIGEREKAVEIANTFPAAGHLTSGQMLESIYEEGSEEKIQQRQINRICLSDALFLNILLTAHQTRDMRERRVWFEKNIRLTELIHDDNNLPHMNLGSIYFNIAKCYMREDNFDMAIETLKKSAEHYIAHDKDSIDTSMKPEMLEYLKEPVFAPIREYEDFKNIVSSLS